MFTFLLFRIPSDNMDLKHERFNKHNEKENTAKAQSEYE